MKQRIHYVPANDGVRLAWAEIGRGPGLVKAATWLTHLQDDLDSPIWSHWVRFFGEHFRYVRYDERGCGMSDWQAGDLAQQHRSEEHTSELQSLMRISYAVFCLKKQKTHNQE